MTKKIARFLAEQRPATPCLVMDLDRVADNYRDLRAAVPEAGIYYAIKANPAPEVLALLARLGSSFDTASVNEIDMVLAAGVGPERISFGNTIKKQADIAAAHARGVRLYALDSEGELDKLAAAAPGSKVFCRILTSGAGADWPLSRKFGCDIEMARDLLVAAKDRGVVPHGVSFHVGSQQRDPAQWDRSMSARSSATRRSGTRRSRRPPGCSASARSAACRSPCSTWAAASRRAIAATSPACPPTAPRSANR